MLYLIGGAPRAGKSTLAQTLMAAAGIPFLGVDYIKMAFAKAMPALGVDPNNNDLATAQQLWPFVEAMATAMLENDHDYALEGTYILPAHAHSLQQRYGRQVRACFVGFHSADVGQKVEQLKAHRGRDDDWLHRAADEELVTFVRQAKALSSWVRADCKRLGFRYFDSADNLPQTVDDAVAYLRA